jgi:ankyrin repeat protein
VRFFKLRKRQSGEPDNSTPKSNSQNQDIPHWNTNVESLENYRRTLQEKNPNPRLPTQSTFTPNREAHRTTQDDAKDQSRDLWAAIRGKDDKRCLFLLEQGARWEGTTPSVDYCQTALHLASGNNLLETCKELIRRGADVNAIDANGNTPLYEAAGFGNAEICELLLLNGAMPSLSIKNRDGYTPLLEAEEYSHDEVIEILHKFSTNKTAGNKAISTPTDSSGTKSEIVSTSRLWKCPKCGELLEKKNLGIVWMPGDALSRVAGTGTCSRCGSNFPQSDIYGGRFDASAPNITSGKTEQYTQVSVVVFKIGSNRPPLDVESYCMRVLKEKLPRAELASYYIVGFPDDLRIDEAYLLYQSHVSKGQLPDLGKQIDYLKKSGTGDDNIVALFFSKGK